MRKEQAYKSTYILFLNLAIVSLGLLILSQFQIIQLPIFFTSTFLFFIVVFSIALSILYKSKLNHFHNRSTHFMDSFFQTSPYFFLAILITLAINQFLKLDFITERNTHIIILGVAFGFFAFYANHNRIEREMENEKQIEESKEQQRASDFQHRFPRISRVWGLRSVVKWVYKEGWGYTLGLAIILIVGFILRIWNLNKVGYSIDEGIYYIIFNNFAKGNILPFLDSGGLYLRNFIYTYPAYWLTIIVNNPLISLRSISLVFGIGVIIISYFFAKKLFDKKTALFCAGLISILSYFIFYSFHGKHYLMILFFYVWFLYLICFFSPSEKKFSFILLSILLGLNYEYVFLLIPVLFLLAFKNKDKSYFIPIFLIVFCFLIQYFVMSKWISLTLPGFEPTQTNLINLNFLSINFLVSGIKKLNFLISPLRLLLVFLIGAIIILKKRIKINPFLQIFLFQLFIELLFFSFFFQKNPIRYRQSLFFLIIIFTSYLYFILSTSLKKRTLGVILILSLLIYLITPVDLNYPTTSTYSKDNLLPNYLITKSIFTDPYSFSSISGNFVMTNYDLLTELNTSGAKVVTTDMYNMAPYIKIDYILNDYLRPYYTYYKENKTISIYNNIQWINLDELKSIASKEAKVMIIADSRFRTNVNQETKDFVYSNFNLMHITKPSYIGNIDGADKNNIEIFESK